MPRTIALIAAAALLAAALLTAGGPVSVFGEGPSDERKVLVIGIDGMDPQLLGGLIDAGRMPNFARVADQGTFMALQTSAPPQSPVAWSDFITGADAGTHQIYDFIHREADPPGEAAVVPYLSTSKVEPPKRDWAIPLGSWRLPLSGSTPVSLRRGVPFWDHLAEAGIETDIYRVPANYPPPAVTGPFRCVCGMGTPDLLGTYGQFTLFMSDPLAVERDVSGGRFSRMLMSDDHGVGVLRGPGNYLRRPDERGRVPDLEVEVNVVRDPERDVARIAVGAEVVVLNGGEWSDWVPIAMATGIPGATLLDAAGLPTSLDAMVRFYLRAVHPYVELYVSPLNIDPLRQVNPIGAPGDFPADLARACGRYYTTGIPEDTKALRSDAIDEEEFLQQVQLLKDERFTQYRYALEHFDVGCLFFYFGHIDQLSHIFWRDRDPGHPGRIEEEAERYGHVIDDAYIEMDTLIGEALDTLDENDTLIVMSDHGFTSFRHGLNLNTWLADNGHLVMRDNARRGASKFLAGIDWSATKAYALGLNALYINEQGREKRGIVPAGERDALLDEIEAGLVALRDDNGDPVVDRVYHVQQYYPGADNQVAPDLIVGYADRYRASWATAEGGVPTDLLEDNHDRWSGDHCIAHSIVPGILLTNRKVTLDDPALIDLAPTVLSEFLIDTPPEMTGRVLWGR